MSNTRPRRKPASQAELSKEQRRHLLIGSTFFGAGFADPDSFRLAWSMHSAELTAEFRQKHRSATAARPFGWWFCEHGTERPIVTLGPPVRVLAYRQQHPETFGYLHSSVFIGPDWREWQENEWRYLARVNLLTAEERKALAAMESG